MKKYDGAGGHVSGAVSGGYRKGVSGEQKFPALRSRALVRSLIRLLFNVI